MRLNELASQLTVCRLTGDGNTEVTGIQFDSRRVRPGDLFVCVSGLTVDGHQYASQAVESGACALLTERELKIGVPQLIVKNSRTAMARLSAYYYGYPSEKLKVIGVTGTNGKTTTSYLIEHILESHHFQTGLMGNIALKIGGQSRSNSSTNTQESLYLQQYLRDMLQAGDQYCVMEVSSHGLELERVLGTRFRTGVFTNLTQDHLDFHGTMERYREAKGLLFSRMSNEFASDPARRQYAVLNADDEASAHYSRLTAAEVITYGIDAPADVLAENIVMTAQGTSFRCVTFRGTADISIKLVGRFNVYNALAAIAASLAEGVALEQIAAALATMKPVEGRMEVVDAGQPFLVLVDYSHTPDSLDNALRTIRQFAKGRIIAVFGCGGDRDRGKRPAMGEIAAGNSDYVLVTSDNPRSEDPERIIDDILQGVVSSGLPADRYERIADRRAAIRRAIHLAAAEDVILIAGKGHETYQEISGVKYDFDDRMEARQAIRSRYDD